MGRFARLFLLTAAFAALPVGGALADKTTVCTITVNSADEQETFQRSLPSDRFEFVELVERGRPDWLASACRKGVRCDVLLISGHFDGGDEFYSDRLDARESLPVDELERVSCSDSCPGLFSRLQEVYLFGCNTLNPDALRTAPGEVVRSLVRAGHSPADAERMAQMLSAQHAESNRDRMRQIFKEVPVIYGFSSKAPLGRAAAPILERYFQSGAGAEIGSGRASVKLLALFAASSMTVAAGSSDTDAQAGYRRDVCRFADDRLSPAQKVGFVHDLLRRDAAETRMFLDHIEKYWASRDAGDERAPGVAQALREIADDHAARDRYLELARDADEPATRARMIALAARLGWLTRADERAELARMIRERLAQDDIGPADIDLVCALNADHSLDAAAAAWPPAPAAGGVGRAAVLACLGSAAAHATVLRALTSRNGADVELAQVYLRKHPIVDAAELRAVSAGIARMSNPEAQVRALDTLAYQPVSDRESLDALTGVYMQAKSVLVQRAVAGILLRADDRSLARPELLHALRKHRLKSPDGQDSIDALIRRLQRASGAA